jgi:hypothetical protein
MHDSLIARIQAFTLNARAVLETEAGQQLEGIYGWLPDGRFADPARYPAVHQIAEAGETRMRLETYAEEEKAAGLTPGDARVKLVRETAFTWLNRLVALRMMEERKILRPTVGKLDKSNSFIFWLTAEGNEETYALHQQGALPRNAMGEGPSDAAYRRFLLWQCAQLARDVSVVFDPDSLATRIFPRPQVLKDIVESMNREDLVEAWQAGNEETVGWVYQAFNAEEEAAIRASFLKKHKVTSSEIPPVTQLFTPRWVVRFLVENTLGRLWVEMHPESSLRDQLGYFVPSGNLTRSMKCAKDITFLDPSCGSMHFGLVAFDLFVEMYKEELKKVGQPGWPDKPSVNSTDDIPASIIANNIFGIDIDLRAVQLSALTLLLKARTLNKQSAFSDRNLACANVETITGGRLEDFISQSRFGHPIYERILRGMASSLKDSDQLGSLIRLEKTLEYLIAEERKKIDFKTQLQLSFPGISQEQFTTKEGIQEFFGILHEQIVRYLDGFVKDSRGIGNDPGHFVSETEKGLRFLGIVSSQYDIVATNPPYLDSRDYSQVHKLFLESCYPDSKRNLYAAFMERCADLTRKDGFVGMLTGQSFMFIKTFEGLRKKLLDGFIIKTLAQFDYNLFKGRVDTVAFVLSCKANAEKKQTHDGTYFRVVRERGSEFKRIAFEEGLGAFKAGRTHPAVFACRQEDFDAIPGKPWVYWMPPKLRRLFRELDILGNTAPPKQGLATADNTRFLRKWWEIGLQQIERNATSCSQSKATCKKWFPYMKGGSPTPWYGNQEHVLNWKMDGAEIRIFTNDKGKLLSRPQNTNFYFRKGVTWSDVSSKGFAGRLSPGGFVHDVKGMTCYPPEDRILTVLGLFNSSVANFVLSALNPTISFQVGDIERLPIPDQSSETLDAMVAEAVALARQDSAESEITYDFIHPPISVADVDERHSRLHGIEEEIDREVTRLYGLTEEDRLALQSELEGRGALAEEDTDDDASSQKDDDDETVESVWTEAALARAWVGYAFGAILGRYAIDEPGGLGCGHFDETTVHTIRALIDADGVMISQPSHPQDITARTLRCLEGMRGGEAAHALIRQATGSNGDPEELLRGYLDRFTGTPEVSFWRHHFQLYRKRPIYWPLQSPKRKLTVWVFQERFTRDTLFKVRSELVDPKARWLDSRIRELKARADQSTGAEKRRLEKEASQLADEFDDVQEFSRRLSAVMQRGYTPRFDDGVLINAAPLWELLPSWPDTRKAWQDLATGKYDWAHQAMDHWPDRVKAQCRENKSLAIAHGLA